MKFDAGRKKTDLAYAAGIIDADGTIVITKSICSTCRRGYRVSMFVQVANTSKRICQWLKSNFNGSLHLSQTKFGSEIWIWSIKAQQALAFLILISPYLQYKGNQAQIAITFQKQKKKGGMKTDKQLAIEEAQVILLRNMHQPKRGRTVY